MLVASPAAADADAVTLDCSWAGGPYTGYWYEASVVEAGGAYSGPATVEINADPDGANVWVSTPATVTDGSLSAEVANFFSGVNYQEVGIRVTAGTASDTCWAVYEPVLLDYSGSLRINAGDTAAVLADGLLSEAVASEPIQAYLFVRSGSSWVDVADARLSSYGHYAVLSYRPPYSRDAYIAVYSALDDRYLGSTDTFTIDVQRSTPTVISKPTSLIQGKTASITAAYGNASTSGKAYLQVYSGKTWKTVSTKTFTRGVVAFTRAQTATSKYRVAFALSGKATVYTASFTMTYLPVFSITAPKSAKRNDWIDFTLVNRWDKNGSVKLQYYSAGAWRTYRTYSVSAKESISPNVQIRGTYSWRVLAGSFASPSVKVVAR